MSEIKTEVFELLDVINNDTGIPKNVKEKILEMNTLLKEQTDNLPLKINKVLQGLDDLSEDNNIPEHVRTQIWSIVSLLEKIT